MAIRLSTGLRQALLGRVASRQASVIINAQTTIAAVDGGAGVDSFTDSGNGFVTAGFSVGDSFLVYGFTGGMHDIHGPFTVVTVAVGTIEVATTSLTADAAGEAVTMVLLKGGSFRDLFKDGILDIYSGVIPANADAIETGTLLVSITVASGAFTADSAANGLEFDAPSGGTISKDTDTWSGVAAATGEAGYYRFYDNGYHTGTSTTAIRFDGTCAAVSGGDLNMSDLTCTQTATKEIDSFTITLPAY
jgi:hypothetical protein